jgi:oligopeptide transport system substrate-binding protein
VRSEEATTSRPHAAYHEAERMLMDEAVIAPIYFYTEWILIKPNVKGYVRSVTGQIYFKEAYLE